MRLPIPPRLWKAAAKVAHEHGVCRTAQVLRFGVRQAEADGGIGRDSRNARFPQGSRDPRGTLALLPAGAARSTQKGRRTRPAASLPSFLEVVGSSAIAGSECVIELEGAQGKMRIQWKGMGAPDLAALGRVLLEPGTR